MSNGILEDDLAAVKAFSASLTRKIGPRVPRRKLDQFQAQQMEALYEAEQDLSRLVTEGPWGKEIWEAYLDWASNHLSHVRPHFRVRSSDFEALAASIRAGDVAVVAAAPKNHAWARWVAERFSSHFLSGSTLKRAMERLEARREEVAIANLPLAISRASIFARRTQASSLSRMDLIQICCEGLMVGIDKYSSPTWTKVFRSVLIGRMVGLLILRYSEKMLKFGAADKKRLYHAAKVLRSLDQDLSDLDALAAKVTASIAAGATGRPGGQAAAPKNPQSVSAAEIGALVVAGSPVSASTETKSPEDGEASGGDMLSDLADQRPLPDALVLERERARAVEGATRRLRLRQQKFLTLSGVDFTQMLDGGW